MCEHLITDQNDSFSGLQIILSTNYFVYDRLISQVKEEHAELSSQHALLLAELDALVEERQMLKTTIHDLSDVSKHDHSIGTYRPLLSLNCLLNSCGNFTKSSFP